MTEPVLPATVTEALESMLTQYSAALNSDPGLLVHVAVARKLARRVDSENDGSKLAALVIRLRQAVELFGAAAPEVDEFDEIAARRREHERHGQAGDRSGSRAGGDAEGA